MAYRVRTQADLAWLLFHEGFRSGLLFAQTGVTAPNAEAYIRAVYEEILRDIRAKRTRDAGRDDGGSTGPAHPAS